MATGRRGQTLHTSVGLSVSLSIGAWGVLSPAHPGTGYVAVGIAAAVWAAAQWVYTVVLFRRWRGRRGTTQGSDNGP